VPRIGTWNLENLFRPQDGAGLRSRGMYRAKLKALAEVITAIAPDVLTAGFGPVGPVGRWGRRQIVSPVVGAPSGKRESPPSARAVRVLLDESTNPPMHVSLVS
jgi:hypothetical protein